jgi:hypothetical protein
LLIQHHWPNYFESQVTRVVTVKLIK